MAETLAYIAVQATRILVPIIILLGVVSNVLNILVLSRARLNRHPCSLYFSFMAFVNLFYCTFLMMINLLADGYQLDLALSSVFFCKLISYLLNLCPNISVYLIVLASLDRYSASCRHVGLRRFSDVRVARWAIGVLILTLTLLLGSAFAAFNLFHDPISVCNIPPHSSFGQIFLILVIILFVIVAPVLMLSFGLLTIGNASQVRINSHRLTRYHRTERQLSRMLLLQVGVHTILVLPFCLLFLMIVFPISFRLTTDFYYMYIICKLPFYMSFTTGFFSYILSAKVYRQELVRLLGKLTVNRRVSPLHTAAKPIHTLNMNR